MGLPKNAVILPTMLSPLGKACSKMDLAAVHDILLKTGYKDEEGAENELSFQEWTQQVQEMLNMKKFGDIAFRDKDFKNSIEYYSKVRRKQIHNSSCSNKNLLTLVYLLFLVGGDNAGSFCDSFRQTCFLLLNDRPTGACAERCNAGSGVHSGMAHSFLLAGFSTLQARNGK